MLDFAYEAGIRDFDVARSYGRGEEFLGEWLRAHNPPGVHVSSKWGYVYTAGWEVAHDPPEVKHHDVETFQRQLERDAREPRRVARRSTRSTPRRPRAAC